ncbi:MAG: hypothetical protein JWQ07_4234 [Ramlibacter sp.]|nr:hypothetical protein [Ramlibacter sp.]
MLAVVDAALSQQHRLDIQRLELSQYFIAMEIKASESRFQMVRYRTSPLMDNGLDLSSLTASIRRDSTIPPHPGKH